MTSGTVRLGREDATRLQQHAAVAGKCMALQYFLTAWDTLHGTGVAGSVCEWEGVNTVVYSLTATCLHALAFCEFVLHNSAGFIFKWEPLPLSSSA